ncbi:MAG: hypothetical protein ACMUEM_05110 [Flavobacteriales bacterium AspAUS03]
MDIIDADRKVELVSTKQLNIVDDLLVRAPYCTDEVDLIVSVVVVIQSDLKVLYTILAE